MYEQVFNFNARPFTSTPYVNHYFGASAINQAFGQAAICIQRGSGPVIAIGDVGTGKSLLLAKLAAEHQSVFQIVDIDSSRINSRKDLLQNILFQLGKPFNMDGETELRFAVVECANPTEASPNGLLVLVDDAETLTAEIFEELRVLTNIVVDGSPQVRLVLAGRKSLEEKLADPALASFSQRIASRVFLTNLSRDETYAYVVEHINRVGGDGQRMFPAETAVKLHELTDGCPRLINQVCDFVLILASTRGATTVSAGLIEEAWNDVQSLPMGSASIAASPLPQSTEDGNWTLIEFGQLNDDLPEPAGATVYDFENTSSPAEPAGGDAPQQSELQQSELQQSEPQQTIPEAVTRPEPATDPQVDLAAAALASTTGIDPELGIDLGSLQAMQDAAAANQTPAEPSNEIDAAPNAQTDAPSTETDAPIAETGANEASDDARIAMQQQLAAVFGTPTPDAEASTPVASVTAEPSGTFQPNPQQPVDANPTATANQTEADQPAESNPLAKILSASALAAGVVGGASQLMASEDPDSTDTFEPASSTLENSAVQQSVPTATQSPEPPIPEISSVPASPNVAAPIAESAPALPVEQFAPATQPLEQIDEAPVAAPASAPAATSPPAQNPFNESFEIETKVESNVANDTISQNQNALKLSSADLSQLTPLHDPSPDSIVQQAAPTPQPPEPSTTNLPDASSFAPPIAQQTPAQTTAEPGAPLENAPAAQPQTPDQRGFSILPMGTPAPADPNVTEADTELRKPHNNETVSDEISRKADEILARLQNNKNLAPAVMQEEQILSNIQQQQQEVADSQLLGEPERQPASIPVPSSHQDDSEMLVVNPNTSTPEAKQPPETLPMTDSPVSSGRATRMDYEQLFDRLRNQPEENTQ